jgi:hypothetical protein
LQDSRAALQVFIMTAIRFNLAVVAWFHQNAVNRTDRCR